MKYALAICVCLIIMLAFHIGGAALFHWKHGGGFLPQIFLYTILFFVFRAITKKKVESESDNTNS